MREILTLVFVVWKVGCVGHCDSSSSNSISSFLQSLLLPPPATLGTFGLLTRRMSILMIHIPMGAEWRCVSMEPMLLSAIRGGMTRMLLLCAVLLAMDHLFTVS